MITNELSGILGLCRRAGKMSLGHDAVITSIKKRKAYLAVTCSDISERMKQEIKDECSFENRNIKYIDATFSMEEFNFTVNARGGVFSIDDRGFAEKLISIMNN